MIDKEYYKEMKNGAEIVGGIADFKDFEKL